MVRFEKVSENTLSETEGFLQENAFYNMYIIGDINKYGVNSGDMEVWAGKRDKEINYVLMRYLNSFVISPIKFELSEADKRELTDCFKRTDLRCISGCSDSISNIKALFADSKIEEATLMVLEKSSLSNNVYICGNEVRQIEECDLELIRNVYLNNSMFKEKYENEDGQKRMREIFKNGRYYGYYDKNRVVAVACISADSNDMGVLDGVAVIDSAQLGGVRNKACNRSVHKRITAQGMYSYILQFSGRRAYIPKGGVS